MVLTFIRNRMNNFFIGKLFFFLILYSCNKSIEVQSENWPNGKPKVRVSYENHTLDGRIMVVKYFNEGQNDTNSYVLVKYYDNGQMSDSGKIINDKKEGLWKEWYKNGNPAIISNYKNGYRIGHFKSWLPDGSESEEFVY